MLGKDSFVEELELQVIKRAGFLIFGNYLCKLFPNRILVKLSVELAEDHYFGQVKVVVEIVVEHRVELVDWHAACVNVVTLEVVRKVGYPIDLVILEAVAEVEGKVLRVNWTLSFGQVFSEELKLVVGQSKVVPYHKVLEYLSSDIRCQLNAVILHRVKKELKLTKQIIAFVCLFVETELTHSCQFFLVVRDSRIFTVKGRCLSFSCYIYIC